MPLTDLRIGLQKVKVGQSTDLHSPLNGVHFHVLHRQHGTFIHLIGSNGPARGAIYHVHATKIGDDSSFRCVLPSNFLPLIEAEFDPSEELLIGTQKSGNQIIVSGALRPRSLVFSVEQGWGNQGLACFADSTFTVVERDVYWVKGGVKPLAQKHHAVLQTPAAVRPIDIFTENDFDDEDEHFEEGPADAASITAAPIHSPAAPVIRHSPSPIRLAPAMPPTPSIPLVPTATQPIQRQKAPARDALKAHAKQRLPQNNQLPRQE